MQRAFVTSAQGARRTFPFQKKKTLLVQAKRKGTSARPEGNGHPSGFFYSPQTDYTHQIRRKAGKFHWLLGSRCPALPHQLRTDPHTADASCLPNGEQPWSRSVSGFRLFSIHTHLLGEQLQPMALNAGPMLTTPHFLMPGHTFLTKFRLEHPPPLRHLHVGV